jgi:hypothetical protein
MKNQKIKPKWLGWLVACPPLAIALVAIGDQFPFSPFPMYSNIDSSADVLYVTNRQDEPLAISSIFDVGSAQAKKRFEKELQAVADTRDYEKATREQVNLAAQSFLQQLWKDRKVKKTEALELDGLRAHVITISLDADSKFQRTEQLLGEIVFKP